ncbi:DUF6414 family protein [Allobranchiibius huperziae]|uniref:Uncharacterized protein n=1 Tax=Allobranchiibius huperziae TaxID=1874116 RepID=A0A853DKD5_9MICO|nr:hypothetical protein [Allobranchiibius huperziae]NYJ76493.1 hypothetical protein [Allobranchiibius huperziae]
MSIYQNPDYVEGILQQTYGQPLLTEFGNEMRDEGDESKDTTKGGKAKTGVTARFPGLFGGEATAEADYENRLGQRHTTGTTATSRAHYTQPYYLHVVRSALRQAGLIQDVAGRTAAASLEPGDFVEFSTAFEPSQITALLDIVTPDLVEQVVRRRQFTAGMASFEGGALEKVQEFKLRLEGDMDTWGAIGRTAVEAVRADFRSTKTREFYGRVGEGPDALTFITMCDAKHFVVEDEDRILDGRFTVLGKVVNPVTEDEPILARNKVLERLKPEAVDRLVEAINESVRQQTDRVDALTQPDDDDRDADDADVQVDADDADDADVQLDADEDQGSEAAPADVFNFTLDARVAGASVRVIPVAIYI